MDEMVAALIGALVGGLVTAWLAPRLEASARRQHRWEEYVFDTSRVVVEQVPAARKALRQKHTSWWAAAVYLKAHPEAADRLEPEVARRQRDAVPTHDEWSALVDVRLRWLARRLRHNPDEPQPFEVAVLHYQVMVGQLTPYSWTLEDVSEDPGAPEPRWDAEAESYQRLFGAAETIAATIVPFPPTWRQKFGRWKQKTREQRGFGRAFPPEVN